MGALGGNALLDTGVVAIDESHADAAIDIAKDLKDATGDDYKALVEDLKDVIGDALSSPQKTDALKKNMEKPVTVDDIPETVTDGLGKIPGDLEFEIETQGDLVAAVLAVDFLEKVEDLLGDLGEDEFDWDNASDEDKGKAEELIGDAMEVLAVIEAISPTNAIGLTELLAAFGDFGRSRGVSRDEGGPDLEKFEAIIDMLIESIGTTGGKINEKNLNSMISNFGLMRTTYEQLARNLGPRHELEENDALNYLLSVFFTEANKLFKESDNTFADLINAFIRFEETEDEGEFAEFAEDLQNAEDVLEILTDKNGTPFKTFEKIMKAIPNSSGLMDLLDELDLFG